MEPIKAQLYQYIQDFSDEASLGLDQNIEVALRFFAEQQEALKENKDVARCLSLIEKKLPTTLLKERIALIVRAYFPDSDPVRLKVSGEEIHLSGLKKTRLMAESNYFKTLFSGNFIEKNLDEVEIKEIPPEQLKLIIELICTQGTPPPDVIDFELLHYGKILGANRLESLLLRRIRIAIIELKLVPEDASFAWELQGERTFREESSPRFIRLREELNNYCNRYLAHLGSYEEISRFLDQKGSDEVENREKLEFLNLHEFSQLSAEDLSKLLKLLPNLDHIIISHTCTDKMLETLHFLQKLRKLDFTNCASLTDLKIEKIANLTNLRELRLKFCKKLTDAGVEKIAHLKGLRKLDFSGCEKLKWSTLEKLTCLTELQELNLSSCSNLTDAAVEKIASIKSLTRIDLSEAKELTGATLEKLAVLVHLKELNLKGCQSLTDAGVEKLSQFKNLQAVDLCLCAKVTPASLEKIQKRGFHIKYFLMEPQFIKTSNFVLGGSIYL